MNKDDFRHMRRGKVVRGLNANEVSLLQAVDIRGQGSDKALLALHGFSSTPAVFRYLIPQLKTYDAIVCPILTGPDLSIDALSVSKASDWLMVAQNAYADLSQHYQKVDVLGLSLGGLLACQLSQTVTINHLYLLAPALKLTLSVEFNLRLAQALRFLGFHLMRNKAGNVASDQYTEIAFRKIPISMIVEMLRYLHHFHWVPPTCPVDLFLGTKDPVVNSQAVAHLFSGLSNVNLHWLHNSAHILPLDGDLEEIVQCINAN